MELKLPSKFTIFLSTILIVLTSSVYFINYFFYRTETVTGKLLLVQTNEMYGESIIKVRTSQGGVKKLELEETLGNEPEKIICVEKNKIQRDVSINQFIEDVKAGGQDIPKAGIPITIQYNPKEIHVFSDADGEVEVVKYELPILSQKNKEKLVIKELSRKKGEFLVTFDYKFNGKAPNVWYLIDGEEGDVEVYKKEGERFIETGEYLFREPQVKLQEEFEKPNLALINFSKKTAGNFAIKFTSEKQMIENSFWVMRNLKDEVNTN